MSGQSERSEDQKLTEGIGFGFGFTLKSEAIDGMVKKWCRVGSSGRSSFYILLTVESKDDESSPSLVPLGFAFEEVNE